MSVLSLQWAPGFYKASALCILIFDLNAPYGKS